MTIYKSYRVGGGNSPLGFLGPLLILAVFFTALFFLAKGVFWLLSWVAPVLLILTVIMDYTVISDFFKFVWKLLKENTLIGVLAVFLVIFGYPIVAGYLFFRALAQRSVKKVLEKAENERNTYTEYEEVEHEDDRFLELPPLYKDEKHAGGKTMANDYDDMFK